MPVTINGNGSITGLSVGGLGSGVVNTATNADHLVTVAESAGGTVVGTFTLMRSESALIEKQTSHVIFAANAAVKGAKVGYTN